MPAWEVEVTDEFAAWYEGLSADEQESVTFSVELLMEKGPMLPHPHSSGIKGSRHGHMRELRVQHEGRPYRVLYAFDPRRAAILLVGGEKTGLGDRWYVEFVAKADDLYDAHIEMLKAEGLIDS